MYGLPQGEIRLLNPVPDLSLSDNADRLMIDLMEQGTIVYVNEELAVSQTKFDSKDKVDGFYQVFSRKAGLLNYSVFYAGDQEVKYVDRVFSRKYDFIEDIEESRKNNPILVATTTFIREPERLWCPDGVKSVEKAFLYTTSSYSKGIGYVFNSTKLSYDSEAAGLINSACKQIELIPGQKHKIIPAGLKNKA